MAKQTLNRGATANDGQGDSLRDGAEKINANFSEIYSVLGDGSNLLTTDIDFGANKLFFANMVDTVADLADINASKYHGLLVHVHENGSIYYAHAGTWQKLLSDTSTGTLTNYSDPLDSVAYSGNYNELSNRPSIPAVLTDLSIVDGSAGQVLSTDGTGNFTFRDVEATSVTFGNVTDKPTTLSGYGITDAFTGRYEDLENKPTLFSGDYDDLTNKPTVPADVSDLTDNTGLLFDGEYSSLENRPAIPSDLEDLSDDTGLLFSRSYNDLTNKPTSFADLSTLQMVLGVEIDEFSNDGAMTDNSTSALVTERAVKTYVTDQIASAIPNQDLNTTDAVQFASVSSTFDGDLNGSVFADDSSTLLVDAVNGKVVGAVAYTPSTDAHWTDPNPTTVADALDRLAAAVFAVNGGSSI